MIRIHFLAAAEGSEPTTIEGRPGQSLMQAAVDACVAGIEADCGGMLTCATCHVYLADPRSVALPPPADDELEMLDFTAAPRRPDSRLSCQVVLTDAMDGLVVQLPECQH